MSAPNDLAGADIAAQRLMRRVLSQWWLVGLCALIAAVAAYAAASQQTKQYEATSTIEVGAADAVAQYLADDIPSANRDPEREIAGAVETFMLRNVRSRAVALLEQPIPATATHAAEAATPATADELQDAVRIESKPDSNVLTVIARDPDPLRAKHMSNAMVEAFAAQRRATMRLKINSAKTRINQQLNSLPEAERDGPDAQVLRGRLRTVGVIGATANGNVTKLQGAPLPEDAVSPKVKRSAILGLLAGGLLGLGIALLRARLDDRIHEADELTELWPLPVVGIVPNAASLRESGRQLPEPAALEALALARTNLRYLNVGGAATTLGITSATEAEGKSTISWHLGVAAATTGMRVAVVEADLRRPKLTSRLELRGDGLSEVLAGIATLADVIQSVPVSGPDGAVACTVDLVAAGVTPPSPLALLESERLAEVLAELGEQYDLVVIDTPPATVVADAVTLSQKLDAMVIVSRIGTVRSGAFKRLRETLTTADAPVIGQIVNGERLGSTYGYYTSYVAAGKSKARATRDKDA